MGADPTCDQINDWFKIGTQVRVATIPQSQLGGFPLDPETGQAAVVNYRPICAAYRRYLDSAFWNKTLDGQTRRTVQQIKYNGACVVYDVLLSKSECKCLERCYAQGRPCV